MLAFLPRVRPTEATGESMTSKRVIMQTFAATLLAVGSAGAQNTLSIAGGVAIPTGDVGSALNLGYNASAALTAKPPLASVGIRLEGMFNSFGLKNDSGGASTQRIAAFTANATLSNPATPLRSFYLIGGIGLYNTDLVGGPDIKSNNDIGFNVGLGIILTSAVGTFIEVRYHHVPSEQTTVSFIPVTLGLRF